MTEYLFARQTDVDVQATIDAKEAAEQAQAAAEQAETNAEAAQTGAETAQGLAEIAQAAAEQAALDAEAAADNFDDVYLGSKAADPTLDNDGNALVEGQLYWNSTSNQLRVYDGAAWAGYAAQSGITALVEDTSPQLGGNLDLNGFVITGLVIGTNVQAWDAQLDEWATVDPSDNGKTLVAAADYAAMRALLDLEAGTDFLSPAAIAAAYQPLDADLTAIAALTTTSFGRSVLELANAAAGATLFGLGTGDSPLFTALSLGNADTTLARAAGGIVSVEGTRLYKAGRETLYIPAAAWQPTVTSGCGRSYTELDTNDIISETIDFDTTSQEFATCEIVLPNKWNAGTFTYRFRWRATAGSVAETVEMQLAAVAISNDDPEDAALGTGVAVSDALIATGDHHISDESSPVTIGGTPAKADKLVLKIQRNVSNDNLAADAMLEGVEIFWTSEHATDAGA